MKEEEDKLYGTNVIFFYKSIHKKKMRRKGEKDIVQKGGYWLSS